MEKKVGFHPRSYHSTRYDLVGLAEVHAPLKELIRSVHGQLTLDFANPAAVKALNTALLKHFYGIKWWDIPAGFLCPPVPGRADYVHSIADLLLEEQGAQVKILDVGVGANTIYPLLGHQLYGWCFVGSDVDAQSLSAAQKILQMNPELAGSIELRLQPNTTCIFENVIKAGEKFSATLCNPPFHTSAAEARAGSERKQKKLGLKKSPQLNFGGQSNELWCEGGEVAFLGKMVEESVHFGRQCRWFTTLVSKGEHLPKLRSMLACVRPLEVRVIEKAQGQKKARILAWRFQA